LPTDIDRQDILFLLDQIIIKANIENDKEIDKIKAMLR